MLIKNLENLPEKIDVEALPSYRLAFPAAKDARTGYPCSVELIDSGATYYSEEYAYEYKVIRYLTNYTDPLAYLAHFQKDFYVSIGGRFYKTISDLMIGNILESNNIKFNIGELYVGGYDSDFCLSSTFHLIDKGVVLSISPSPLFDLKLQLDVCCKFEKTNPFRSDRTYSNRHYFAMADLTEASFVELICNSLNSCYVNIDRSKFILDELQFVCDARPLTIRGEMRKLKLIHEVPHECR
jgi:hypothetical protein